MALPMWKTSNNVNSILDCFVVVWNSLANNSVRYILFPDLETSFVYERYPVTSTFALLCGILLRVPLYMYKIEAASTSLVSIWTSNWTLVLLFLPHIHSILPFSNPLTVWSYYSIALHSIHDSALFFLPKKICPDSLIPYFTYNIGDYLECGILH